MIHSIFTPEYLPTHGVDIFVFGDRQQGASGYNPEAWEAFKQEFKASPNAYALGLGDYGDWLRPTMRHLLAGAMGRDDSAKQMLDKMVLKEHDKIIDDMEFLKGRLIGLHEGHHTHYLMDGTNLDQRLSGALDTKFLGWSATIRLIIKKSDAHHVVTLLSTHGNANGRKVHSALGWMDNNFVNSWIADVYISGHGCKNGSMAPFERQAIRRTGPAGIIKSIPRILVVGGFSEAYTNGWSSDYVERNGMSPQPMGWGQIRIRPVYTIVASETKSIKKNVSRSGKLTTRIEVVNKYYEP